MDGFAGAEGSLGDERLEEVGEVGGSGMGHGGASGLGMEVEAGFVFWREV